MEEGRECCDGVGTLSAGVDMWKGRREGGRRWREEEEVGEGRKVKEGPRRDALEMDELDELERRREGLGRRGEACWSPIRNILEEGSCPSELEREEERKGKEMDVERSKLAPARLRTLPLFSFKFGPMSWLSLLAGTRPNHRDIPSVRILGKSSTSLPARPIASSFPRRSVPAKVRSKADVG